MFDDFDGVLGPLGASKRLHVLAPRFFPLWDGAVARSASLYFVKRGANGGRYWRWMVTMKRECEELGVEACGVEPAQAERRDPFGSPKPSP
jgi:hypothetical protein